LPVNGPLPPKSATRNGSPRRQPLRCRDLSSRLRGDQQAQPLQCRQEGHKLTSSGSKPGQSPTVEDDGPTTPGGSPNKNHLYGLQGYCQNGAGRSGSGRASVAASQGRAYGARGRPPIDRATTPRGASGTSALGAAGGRLPGAGAGLGDRDPQQRSRRQGGSTRGSETRGGDGRQGRSGGDTAGHHAPTSNAHEDSGGASNPGGTTAHQRTGGARAWTSFGHQTRASNGYEVGAATSPGIGAARRPSRRP
jgi:hypothetical protein